MGLNYFVVQYPLTVQISTVARKADVGSEDGGGAEPEDDKPRLRSMWQGFVSGRKTAGSEYALIISLIFFLHVPPGDACLVQLMRTSEPVAKRVRPAARAPSQLA
jgi:hypothetical protein